MLANGHWTYWPTGKVDILQAIITMRISLLLSCIVWQALSSTHHGSEISPIRHWDASYAASCAQASCLAMKYQDFIVVFLRSPSTNAWKPTPSILNKELDLFGLRVSPVEYSMVQFAPSWFSFLSSQVVAMTGLAADVEHVVRVIQRQGDSHFNVYDKSMTTHTMTQRLAAIFQQQAAVGGGRPYGVQALLLGGDDIDPKRGMCIYSVDPSGSWQSWGAGACIGKYAKQIRKQIAKKLETPASSLKEALEYLIECWVDTCKAENVNLKKQEDYQALILHRDPENQHCKLFQVTDESVNDMVATLIAIKTP